VIKIASTTLGETGADMFSMTYDLGYAVTILIFLALFAVFLGIKLAIKRYDPILYWLVFTASAIAGTAISDCIDRTLGLGYATGSAILIVLLVVVLTVWKMKEKTISVETSRLRGLSGFTGSRFSSRTRLARRPGIFSRTTWNWDS
jgi:uncharacterized membrane-anchored protein